MAIILPQARPVIRIENGSFGTLKDPWLELEHSRNLIERAISCVGRIETTDKSIPYLGTAFLVADNIILTTRHVVATFAAGVGDKQLKFRDDRKIWINFNAESPDDVPDIAAVTDIIFIHPYWDVAALRVETQRPFLRLQTSPPQKDSTAVAIGYPAFDMRNDADLQNRIFNSVYNVKRMMPGRIRDERAIESRGRLVRAITHDASTLGGTAGAPLVDITTGDVIGVNFAGVYLDANYATPAWELMRDPRVRHHLEEPHWMTLWEEPDQSQGSAVSQVIVPGTYAIKKYNYLSNEDLLQLCELLLLGFPEDERISTLFVGIPPEVVAALPVGANPKEKLLKRLFEMNRLGPIGEHSPLYRVLQTACYFRKEFPEYPRLQSLFQIVAANESIEQHAAP